MKHYKKNKAHSPALITFVAAIIFLLLIFIVSKTELFGKDLSAAIAAQTAALFSSDSGAILTLPRVLAAIAALAMTYVICFILTYLSSLLAKTDRGKTINSLNSSVIRYLGIILGVVWALSVLGMNPTAVFASLGIVTLIVGFGAQSLIEDVISGIFIVFENQYNVGDIIVLDDFRGTVYRIGVRTTSLLDAGGNFKIVNNSEIRNVQNRSQALSIALCDVGISYDEDVRRVEKITEAAFPSMYENNKSIFEAPPTYLGVESIGDSAVILRYGVKCREVNFFVAKRRLNREIRLLFADKGIEIPFMQVDLHSR